MTPITEAYVWQVASYVACGLVAISLWFIVRAINNFTATDKELSASINKLTDAIDALSTEAKIDRVHLTALLFWREKTVDPILTQVSHMLYNLSKGIPKS
jgi:hypothetical protein